MGLTRRATEKNPVTLPEQRGNPAVDVFHPALNVLGLFQAVQLLQCPGLLMEHLHMPAPAGAKHRAAPPEDIRRQNWEHPAGGAGKPDGVLPGLCPKILTGLLPHRRLSYRAYRLTAAALDAHIRRHLGIPEPLPVLDHPNGIHRTGIPARTAPAALLFLLKQFHFAPLEMFFIKIPVTMLHKAASPACQPQSGFLSLSHLLRYRAIGPVFPM